MNLKDAIRALLAGEEIPAPLRQQLSGLDPESLNEELSTLRRQLEEQENAKLSAEELLKKQLSAALSERDALLTRHKALERRDLIRKLAEKSGCEDPEYLDFLAERQGVDLEDEEAASAFLAEAAKQSPHCFRASVNPGSGAAAPALPGGALPEDGSREDRIGRLVRQLSSAPEIR